MGSGRAWETDDISDAVRLYKSGLTCKEVGEKLNRPAGGVQWILNCVGVQMRGRKRADSYMGCYDGPPIGHCREMTRLERNAIQGSAKLLEAIQRASA